MPFIGSKLKELRASKGLTQIEFHERSGIPLPTIKSLEQDQRKPRDKLEETILKFFGITRAELYDLKNILPTTKIPILTWQQANKLNVDAPLPTGDSHKEFVYNPVRGGPSMFAIRIKDSALKGKLDPEEIVIVDPDETHLLDGKFYFIRDHKSKEGMIRQVRIYGKKVILHSLNEDFPDIDLEGSAKRYEILGRAVRKISTI